MRDRYGANERSQKLKYHVQTSGRSLHAQEMDFNDIRTTLQALIALYDNANSLHTNAYDEAVTTPTAESVRRALAIQLIINREWGLSMNENPNQGSFVIEQLTDLVEEAVLQELERISERGGVLGAMETGYQRGRIQDESMLYEQRKHDGTLPLIGVNTFLDPNGHDEAPRTPELQRSTDEEKQSQIARLRDFQDRHAVRAARRARAAPHGRPGRRQPVRRADGRRAGVLARRDHPHPLRGRAAATGATSEPGLVEIDFSGGYGSRDDGDAERRPRGPPHGRADRRVARAGLHPRRAPHHRRRGRLAAGAVRRGVRPVEQGPHRRLLRCVGTDHARDRRRPRPRPVDPPGAQVAGPGGHRRPPQRDADRAHSCSTCRSTGSRRGRT